MILKGKYVKGIGRAHQFRDVYRPNFNCPMVATFNVQADGPITDAEPTRMISLAWPEEEEKPVNLWLCQINGYWAWAMRWEGTRMPESRIEFVSKRHLPEHLKSEPLTIGVFERWSEAKIKDWASKQYQWQGFSWLPQQRVDSQGVWEIIKPHADWSGADVLDVGSHYGYHSFRASEAGASVVAVEPNNAVRATGKMIARYIEMQDVEFWKYLNLLRRLPDITLYLSVHHQWDADYKYLAGKVADLAIHTKNILFVEVILPPMFGKAHSVEDVDKMVGGQVLTTYKHRMRGFRRIYKVRGAFEVNK